MEDKLLDVSEKVRLLLSFRGLSLKELGAKTGMDVTTLSKVQNGHVVPSLVKLIEISNVCGVHPIYWIENVRPDVCILMMKKLPVALSLAKLPKIVGEYLEHGIKEMKKYEPDSDELPLASNIGEMTISENYYAYAAGDEWKSENVSRKGKMALGRPPKKTR